MARSLHSNPTPLNAAYWHGKRVGLFGGSFHPPHEGHRLIATEALNHFKLDAVWWMVSPKNPLKTTSGREDFEQRLAVTRDFVNHPRMVVTDIEARLDTPYSYKTVVALRKRFPKTEFIWIAGMDNAVLFHRWNDWERLSHLVPFVFFNRPPGHMKINMNKLKMRADLRQHYDCRKVDLCGRRCILDVFRAQQEHLIL